MINITYKVLNKFFYRPVDRSPRISRFLFLLKLLLARKRKRDLLLLITVTKTGTHYLRFLLAYYVLLVEMSDRHELDKVRANQSIIDEFLPNNWHRSYRGFSSIGKPTTFLRHLGLFDIPRSHLRYRALEWRGFKVLHTYRPLIEQAVVSYETKFACDSELMSKYDTPYSLFDATFLENAEQIITHKNVEAGSGNVLRIEFRQIYENPEKCLSLIIMWLGHEPDLKLCDLAAKLCQKTPSILVGAGEKWQRYPNDRISKEKLKVFFDKYSKSGAVDCFKDYFEDSDINEINHVVSNNLGEEFQCTR